MNIKYTPEEREKIVNRYLLFAERPVDIIADTGIAKSTFYRWVNEQKALMQSNNKKVVNIQDYHRLQSKVERLETIIRIIRETKISSISPLSERLSAAESISEIS